MPASAPTERSFELDEGGGVAFDNAEEVGDGVGLDVAAVPERLIFVAAKISWSLGKS